ncbi:hypothetical protein PAXRUDRAFT_769424 [Paxillus rubicundulus Ve08.2h10]|uniref:Uncharacterized protein n=1 Tax=Paxillus rubicundulus Ve08.2h10 TaxID=930991 RepID=A0A0D0E0E3_9AGAM|nr:hypothetical protein PAXRUDRAFT_769424 [Paxillus rubicundulus Ve08.2h10]
MPLWILLPSMRTISLQDNFPVLLLCSLNAFSPLPPTWPHVNTSSVLSVQL